MTASRPSPPESCLVKCGYVLFLLLGLAVIAYGVRWKMLANEAAYRQHQIERGLTPAPTFLNWTSLQGASVRATFVRLEGENVTVKNTDGQFLTFPLRDLDAASQKLARAASAGLPGM